MSNRMEIHSPDSLGAMQSSTRIVDILLQFCNPVYVTLGIIFVHVTWQIIGSVRALEFGAQL